MGNDLFGKKKTLKEIITEQKRLVNKSVRELEREKRKMERDEKKLTIQIKQAAKKGQLKSAKIMAKDLVRIRKHQEKFTGLVANLRAVSMQMTQMASTVQLTTSMRQATRSMAIMNRQMNMPQLQRIMQEFEKQSEAMGMKQEIMGDALDDAMENEEDEEEEEMVVNQIMDELGLNMASALADAPGAKAEKDKEEVTDNADAELESRFNNL
jgi:charged multivesicular body protein 2A